MKTKFFIPIGIALIFMFCKPVLAGNDSIPEKIVEIQTSFGTMKVKLYNETPQHRDNFLKLVGQGFYDELLFHRVIKDFIVQGGDPDSKNARPGRQLGGGDLGYEIPAEFNQALFHKKGALSAARTSDEVNPEKKSSASQFYIVQGKTYTNETLDMLIDRRKQQAIKIETDKLVKAKQSEIKRLQKLPVRDSLNAFLDVIYQEAEAKANVSLFEVDSIKREVYTTVGGTPFLDGAYTVFGEVIEGLEIIDSIANVSVDRNDRPVQDIKMRIKVSQ